MNANMRSLLPSATGLAVALLMLGIVGEARAAGNKKNPTSKIYVADLTGVSTIEEGDKIDDLNSKSVYNAEGTAIETKPDATNAVVLSNGTGVFFEKDTRLEVQKFMQEPFTPNRNDPEVEPSISQTQASLPRGSVGLCTSKLVAGSNMVYNTPQASIAIRGRKVVVETNDGQTTVSLLEGDVTVRGDQVSGGESLKPGQQAIITRKSPNSPPVITIQPIPAAQMAALNDKVTMACMARNSVYFAPENKVNTVDSVFTKEDDPPQELKPHQVLPPSVSPSITVSAQAK